MAKGGALRTRTAVVVRDGEGTVNDGGREGGTLRIRTAIVVRDDDGDVNILVHVLNERWREA